MAINRYTKAIDNALEQYVPLPFDTMFKAGQATQQRYDQSVVDDTATQTGLASIEARSPAYKQYVDKAISGYRDASSNLIKQFNGRLDDPEFKRQQKQLINQYANDPAFQTIKLGNEGIKRSQDIEAQMRAQGKLYISDLSNFKGTDANGKLAVYNGAPQAVNTLDDWTKAGQIAHQSTEDIGNITTNKRNLDRWKQSITGDIAGQTKLLQAYQQQGMSPQQAAQAVKSSIQGLVNQYGVETKTNTGLLNLGLQREEFAYRKQRDATEDQLKRDLAAQKAASKIKPEELIKAPSFNEFQNRLGAVGTTQTKDGESKEYIFGSGKSQYGTKDLPVKNQKITGEVYDTSSGQSKPVSKTVDISDGTLRGYMNAWVNKNTGELIKTTTPTSKPKIEYKQGKPYAYFNGKPVEIEERTLAQYDYNAGDKTTPNLKTVYVAAAPKEAMREMGYSNAYYKGMGRVQHGSAYTSNGKAKLDFNYISKNITNQNSDLIAIKNAESAFNQGTATPEQKQLLDVISNYDSRKAIYDKEILPYFKDQAKTKTIVEEE